ncbi:hypothetical protein [Paenibacillus senegalimassiliensis]|uniref:hypothetical protein n=1 Tax=Paenibacillus senegalimassiliensis TaxID=1737426 RepID=UPI00073E908D|nr:hypothetical protein [Paenibacillus senegalimassiliensis]
MNYGKLKFSHTCTNESEKYILVGSGKDYISEHDTPEEAAEALGKISIGESKWGHVRVLYPGETYTFEFSKRLYPDESYVDWSLE